MDIFGDPSRIDISLDARAATFENPAGGRGSGGTAFGGRKGAPNREIAAGERVVLADLDGPGTVRHIWMTFMPASPEAMRSQFMEVFDDDASEPSVSVPCLDFFGMPHGRPVAFHSALMSANEGRGFNSFVPMPFRDHMRVEYVNASAAAAMLYYQIDYTLQPELPVDAGLLHVSFRREKQRAKAGFLMCSVCWRGASPSASTTTAQPRTSTAAFRNLLRDWTCQQPSPTSTAAITNRGNDR